MKTFYPGHTRAGSQLTELFFEMSRLRGALIDVGDRLSRPLGLTAARWQVLSWVARAMQPAPVSHMAREMGLARQSVQRLTDELATEGSLEYQVNPHHRRAPLVVITPHGEKVFKALTSRQVNWVNEVARHQKLQDVATALDLMRGLQSHLRDKSNGRPPASKAKRGK
ncbi:MAG: MarR family winged helix-turn-helix transcriptional regulator [Terriglobia bacterium]